MIELRPHHLLCIQKFTCYGYDKAFTANMHEVVSLLKSKPETTVTLVEGGDRLCSACPNCIESYCRTADKVKLMDEKVLRFCDLAYGEIHSWKELAEKAADIFKSEAFEDICGDCEWFDLCSTTINK